MAKRQNVLEKLAQGIQKLNTKVEGISGNLPEILLITAYAVGHLLMALVHEPWFDEAEAWQITRCYLAIDQQVKRLRIYDQIGRGIR